MDWLAEFDDEIGLYRVTRINQTCLACGIVPCQCVHLRRADEALKAVAAAMALMVLEAEAANAQKH